MKIKIAVTEDLPHLAKSISDRLAPFENIELLYIAPNGKELLQKISSEKPDLVLMDINMPVMDGIEATRRIKIHFPDVKVIMLTVFDEEEKLFQSILAGATGYLLKDEKPSRIISAIEEAMEGGAPMSPAIASKALGLIMGHSNNKNNTAESFNLSPREVEIMELIARGDTYQMIAEVLFISPKTVRKHIENIYTKLQVHNKVEAIQAFSGGKKFLFLF